MTQRQNAITHSHSNTHRITVAGAVFRFGELAVRTGIDILTAPTYCFCGSRDIFILALHMCVLFLFALVYRKVLRDE